MALHLTVKDFGPIARGRIQLSPLTVFVGPNNSGKSVLAMLVYAATRPAPVLPFRSREVRATRAGSLRTFRTFHQARTSFPSEAVWKEFFPRIIENPELRANRIDPSIIEFFRRGVEVGLERYAANVRSELARSFGERIGELGRVARPRRRRFSVTIGSDGPRWTVQVGSSKMVTEVDVTKLDVPALLRQARKQVPSFFESEWVTSVLPEYAMQEAFDVVLSSAFSEFPSYSFYLPAARSGFLQSHRAIASSVVSRAPYAGIEDMQIPKMTGVIADFISNLLEMPDEPSSNVVNDVASFLEQTLAGSIRVESQPGAYPEFWYESTTGRFPLHRTSSMISELAPIVLYLRHLLDPGELLIIEEPESHLHPASQLLLARALARLVTAGVRVLITTHSDYFLAQLNNLMRAAAVSPRVYKREGLRPEDVLEADRVGAYAFKASARGGSTVRAVKVGPTEGITDDEFAQVAEPLYAQRVVLERKIAESK
jgi:predicted ATPase